MTTGGEGGMVVTNDEKLWRRAWEYKDHGKSYDAVFNKEHPPGPQLLSAQAGAIAAASQAATYKAFFHLQRLSLRFLLHLKGGT